MMFEAREVHPHKGYRRFRGGVEVHRPTEDPHRGVSDEPRRARSKTKEVLLPLRVDQDVLVADDSHLESSGEGKRREGLSDGVDRGHLWENFSMMALSRGRNGRRYSSTEKETTGSPRNRSGEDQTTKEGRSGRSSRPGRRCAGG